MTIEKAITYIDRMSDEDCYTAEAYEAMRMAIKALEKQIPKKPIHDGYDYRCPSCRTAVEYECMVNNPDALKSWTRDSFCGDCGQAIDWEV